MASNVGWLFRLIAFGTGELFVATRAARWLTRAFRGVFEGSNRRSRDGGRRRGAALGRLEALEGRALLSGVWHFASAPGQQPMQANVLTLKPGASLNPIFVAPYDQSSNPGLLVGQTGPLIMDASGNPIWFHPLSNHNKYQAIDFQAQTLYGKPVLSWWQGTISGIQPSNLPPGAALPGGHFVIYNQHYRQIASVQAPKGFSVDEHELLLTPAGNAYIIATKTVRANLTPYGGLPNGVYEDPFVLEINLRTGRVIYSWNMAKHVPLSDSFTPAPTLPNHPWDVYHANSIALSSDGSQMLVSARNTWGIYDISRQSGQILWQVGGKQNQFTMPSSLVTGPYGSAFQYQHDARYTPGGIRLFDDGGQGAPPDGGPYGPGRALFLNLNFQNHTASLASPPLYHNPPVFPNSQGNTQLLPNGNVFVGWGSDTGPGGVLSSYFTEYSPTGSVLADYSLAGQDISYRAFSYPWVGIPYRKPSVAAGVANGQATVYASWNGSTETVAWEVLAGPTRNSLSPVLTAPRTGFETAITTTNMGPYFKVIAIGAGDTILKPSNVVRVIG